MTQEMEKKLEALFKNPDEVNAVFVKDEEKTLVNLAERGIELNKDELGELCYGIMEGMGVQAEDRELTESELDNVAGGWVAVAIGTAAILYTGYRFLSGWADGLNSGGKASSKKGPVYNYGYNVGKTTAGY